MLEIVLIFRPFFELVNQLGPCSSKKIYPGERGRNVQHRSLTWASSGSSGLHYVGGDHMIGACIR